MVAGYARIRLVIGGSRALGIGGSKISGVGCRISGFGIRHEVTRSAVS